MKLAATVRILVVVLAVMGMVTLSGSAQDGFIRLTPEQLKWQPDPEGFQRAVVYGDPAKPGLYIVRVKFPPGVMSAPHFHSDDRLAVVLQGTWYTGTGKEFNKAVTVGLKPGSFMKHPAGAAHYDGAKGEEAIVQIVGMGPTVKTVVSNSQTPKQ